MVFIHAQCEVAANLAADGLAGAGRCGHDDGLAVVQRAQRVDLEEKSAGPWGAEAVGQQGGAPRLRRVRAWSSPTTAGVPATAATEELAGVTAQSAAAVRHSDTRSSATIRLDAISLGPLINLASGGPAGRREAPLFARSHADATLRRSSHGDYHRRRLNHCAAVLKALAALSAAAAVVPGGMGDGTAPSIAMSSGRDTPR